MPCLIIAEIGVNHNGSLELALDSITAAKQAGADVVKFQTFNANELVTASAAKASYQLKTTDRSENQLTMLQRLELSETDHWQLLEHCNNLDIHFLSTPFDFGSLDFLVNKIRLRKLKLSSGDLTNGPMLLACARTGCNLIISTGMASLSEVEQALAVLAFGYMHGNTDYPSEFTLAGAYASERGQYLLRQHVSILHCSSEYPAQAEQVNLNVITTLQRAFGLTTGYSDHTQGIDISLAAVAKGALIIEKHFTLDKNLPGPDHSSSTEPQEFSALVKAIRRVEVALGNGIKRPLGNELINRVPGRKSLVCAQPIKAGELFSEDNLALKRPGNGISPMSYWQYLGKHAQRNYQVGELITE